METKFTVVWRIQTATVLFPTTDRLRSLTWEFPQLVQPTPSQASIRNWVIKTLPTFVKTPTNRWELIPLTFPVMSQPVGTRYAQIKTSRYFFVQVLDLLWSFVVIMQANTRSCGDGHLTDRATITQLALTSLWWGQRWRETTCYE